MKVPTGTELFTIAEQLRTERDAAIAERDAARAGLQIISQGIDPYADQLQNWIAGQIDTALGKVAT